MLDIIAYICFGVVICIILGIIVKEIIIPTNKEMKKLHDDFVNVYHDIDK